MAMRIEHRAEPPTGGRNATPPHRGAVIAFFALAYAWTWAWVIPIALTDGTVAQGRAWPTHVPGLIGPLVAAFVVTACTTRGPGVGDLLARMARWRIGWRWWVAALSPLAYFGLAVAIVSISGDPLPHAGDFARFSGLPSWLGFAGVLLVVVLVNGYGEETGWRGYALPQLQQRHSPIVATLIVAVAWAGWHVPQFLVLQSYRSFSAGQLAGFTIGLTCGAFVATWLYNRTGGSILAVVVWHGVYNALGATKAATAGPGAISAVVSTCIMAQAAVLIVLELRARHREQPSVLGPHPTGSEQAQP